MNRLTIAALAVLAGSVTAPACLSVAGATEVPGLPNCGGNANGPVNEDAAGNLIVPFDCGNVRTVEGLGQVQGVLHLEQRSVTYTWTLLDGPVTFDVPAKLPWYNQESSNAVERTATGTLPAGQTSLTLTVTDTGADCFRGGQVDAKIRFTAGGDGRGRVSGGWMGTESPGCLTGQTIPTTSPPASSVPPAPPTAPPATTPGAPSPGPAASTPTLPATGAGQYTAAELAVMAALLAVGGFGLLRLAGWRRP